ncbi:MAG TPA: hypothetical protein PLK77_10110 [Pyrinomonadaceae bacterium]|nr:hypothetical protein [Pyrinomonadaceae bacterium]
MAEPRPTEKATGNFGRVKTHSRMAHSESTNLKDPEQMYRSNMAVVLYELGDGLENLTTGIRATYILLEEVKRLLEQRR